MFLKENAYDALIEKYCALAVIQTALLKTVIAFYSEFEPRCKSVSTGRFGLCGLTLKQVNEVEGEGRITVDDLMDSETNIRLGAKYLRFLFVTEYEPNFWDILRAYGRGYVCNDMDISKAKRIYFYYSQKSNEPASYDPREMNEELYRSIAAGKHEL